jgi:hypothetical protein
VVGDHYDFLYPLTGPLAAGSYFIQFFGELYGSGSTLVAEVDDITDAGVVWPVLSETTAYNGDGGAYIGELFDGGVNWPAVDAGCGDTLRLRLTMVAGPDAGSFYGFGMSFTLP